MRRIHGWTLAALLLAGACGGGEGGEAAAGGAGSRTDAKTQDGGSTGDASGGGGPGGGVTPADQGPSGGGGATGDAGPIGGSSADARAGGGGGGGGSATDAASTGGQPGDAGPGDMAAGGGEPGGAEPPLRDAGPGFDFGGPNPEDVRMNEVDCHGDDWIEVVNLTDQEIDLSGWIVTDTLDDVAPEGHAYILPPGSLLPASGLYVVEQQDMGDMVEGFEFGISCGDEHVRLVRPDGTTADFVEVPERDNNNAWGRFPDATGEWTHTLPTKGRPNELAIDVGPILYDVLTGGVPTIELFIDPDNVQRLVADPRTTVPADFQIQTPDMVEPLGPLPVGVHLKGRIGSFRPITGKAGFKIDINEFDATQRVFGMKELTLNNMVQDRSAMSQWTAYEIFRAMGVCAPRVGYAWLRVNGEDYGLYADVENYDDLLFSRCFETTGHVYEGRYGEDLRQDLVERLDVKEGDPMERADMHAIVDALDNPPEGDIYGSEAAQALFDWDALITEMAVEMYIGHWDGYAPTRNNWVMHVTGDGRLSLQPWGTDQCFGRNSGVFEGQGRLFQTCMGNPGCRNAYENKMGDVMSTLDGMNLEPRIRDVFEAIRPYVADDPRSPFREAAVSNSVNDLVNFLSRRRMELGTAFECILGANADPDGDGYRCETDCAPDDPNVNPGAFDECRDGIDQDCNGVADDNPGCPDCETIDRGGHRYMVCLTPRSWQAGEEHCAFFGSRLAAIDHQAELDWVLPRARAYTQGDLWTGLNDRDFEGSYSFLGALGMPDPVLPWTEGQPGAGATEEDCIYIRPDGTVDDFNCLRQKAVLCEDACEFNGDRDRDGLNNCSADCDDTDNTIFPGAPEICGDGIDQNCDGVADEGDNCDCYLVFRGAHAYRICGTARTAAEARNACQAQGADLAVFDTPGEAAWVHAQALGLTDAPLWIGLQDRFALDEWNWVDGNPPTYQAWSPAQPDGAGALDCAVQRGDDGLWDDVACDDRYGAICEATCDRRIDTDADGHPACGTDCDDGDPNTHPGAAERCGDGIDQNCDGVVDEGCVN